MTALQVGGVTNAFRNVSPNPNFNLNEPYRARPACKSHQAGKHFKITLSFRLQKTCQNANKRVNQRKINVRARTGKTV